MYSTTRTMTDFVITFHVASMNSLRAFRFFMTRIEAYVEFHQGLDKILARLTEIHGRVAYVENPNQMQRPSIFYAIDKTPIQQIQINQ